MIYVIASPAFKKGSLTEYETLIKIGYTSETNAKKRLYTYRTHNPTNQILFKIDSGTFKDELNLHHYFEKYKYTSLNEWFVYNDEILEFFKTHPTIEDIRRDVPEYIHLHHRDSIYKLKSILRPYIISIKTVIGKSDETIYKDCVEATNEFAENWIKQHYPEKASEILNSYKETQSLITPKMSDFIEQLRDTSIGSFSNRLQKLCISEDFSEDEKRLIAQQVSERFDKYYNILGPEVCKACGYRSTDLNRRIEVLTSEDNIIKEFCMKFKVGNRYTNSQAKQMVKDIYDRLGLYKSPKATDIFEYFEVKRVSMFDENKKKINGIEILAIK